MDILKKLFDISDEKYAEFQAKLNPTVERERIIGVRVPMLRKLAKELFKAGDYGEFLDSLPHRYFDENMLHALIIGEVKEYDAAVKYVEAFLPYIDNWAVCDSLIPKGFKKNKADLSERAKKWSGSSKTYICRFGVMTLMRYFLDDDYNKEYLSIPAKIRSDEYYVNMMIAFYYATALAKEWDDTLPYLEEKRLSKWVHNKTVSKANESFRITDEQKEYLKTLKIK